jgi:hypothetical protein
VAIAAFQSALQVFTRTYAWTLYVAFGLREKAKPFGLDTALKSTLINPRKLKYSTSRCYEVQ